MRCKARVQFLYILTRQLGLAKVKLHKNIRISRDIPWGRINSGSHAKQITLEAIYVCRCDAYLQYVDM